MSGGHFAGLLTLLTCRGSKGQMPHGKFRNSLKAGSGAEWLATLRNLPVISPPLNRHPPSHIFHPTLSDQNGDDGGFVVCGKAVDGSWNTPPCRVFHISGADFSHATPVRSIGQSCAVSGTPFFSALPTTFSARFLFISVLFLSIHLFSVQKHKN